MGCVSIAVHEIATAARDQFLGELGAASCRAIKPDAIPDDRETSKNQMHWLTRQSGGKAGRLHGAVERRFSITWLPVPGHR